MPCELDLCRQGREPCPERAVCFPDTEADEPPSRPEDFMSVAARLQGVALVFAIVCAVMAARYFFF